MSLPKHTVLRFPYHHLRLSRDINCYSDVKAVKEYVYEHNRLGLARVAAAEG